MRFKMRYQWIPFLTIVILVLLAVSTRGDIVNTKHNLSVSGPGGAKAAEEAQICIFCHTPHNSSPRGSLWNRQDPGRTYTPYSSSTAKASAGQPTGASILCLSCHDGTVALGEVLSRPDLIKMLGSPTMPSGSGLMETDLSDDHPISFAYTGELAATRGELVTPSTLTGQVRLDSDGQLQCTSCHDAHDDSFGKFLVMWNKASALCTTCHIKDYWNRSTHKTSRAVADRACESCHRSHTAGSPQRLLHFAEEEKICYTCHNGAVAEKNIQAEFNKSSRHPVSDKTGVHDPTEPAVVEEKHVECVDCHNPHATRSEKGELPGSLSGVRGVSVAGGEVTAAVSEHEICFRCHVDSSGKLAPETHRQLSQTNVRLEFNPSNPSFHPVGSSGRNSNVPSLIAPLNPNSTITCIDCHNNNAGPGADGTGPNGPHGSRFSPLLERRYETFDNTPESLSAYALCYKCHSRNSILSDKSFSAHRKHIVDANTPCNVCHDPHGISRTQGNDNNNSHLINFDTSVVSPNSAGQLQYESQGIFPGACYLNCHEKEHNSTIYKKMPATKFLVN